jgi:hypothetical protein
VTGNIALEASPIPGAASKEFSWPCTVNSNGNTPLLGSQDQFFNSGIRKIFP